MGTTQVVWVVQRWSPETDEWFDTRFLDEDKEITSRDLAGCRRADSRVRFRMKKKSIGVPEELAGKVRKTEYSLEMQKDGRWKEVGGALPSLEFAKQLRDGLFKKQEPKGTQFRIFKLTTIANEIVTEVTTPRRTKRG